MKSIWERVTIEQWGIKVKVNNKTLPGSGAPHKRKGRGTEPEKKHHKDWQKQWGHLNYRKKM